MSKETVEQRLDRLERENKGLKKAIAAAEKPGTVVNFFTGLVAKGKKPFSEITALGADLNAKSHFTNLAQAEIEEELAAERKKKYAKAGLDVPEDPYYPEAQD